LLPPAELSSVALALARLDCFEDWAEWLAGAVVEAVTDPALIEGDASPGRTLGEGGGG
jgi:hypothetical protein